MINSRLEIQNTFQEKGGKFPSSLKKKYKNYCLTNLNQLSELRGTQHSVSPDSLCKFGSFAPVQTAVKAPPAPSRWDVSGKAMGQNPRKKCQKEIVFKKKLYFRAHF